MRTPAAFAMGSSDAMCWRQRISVGAISAPCEPASTAPSSASIATAVLPAPTSPCSRRSMRVGDAMSASISASACAWPSVSEKGQGCDGLCFQPPIALYRPAFGGAHAGADHQQRELVGEQFVIGEAAARLGLEREVGFMRRRVRAHERDAEALPILRLAIRRVLPLRHRGNLLQRRADRLGDRLRGQAFGQRIDGLVQRQRAFLSRLDDIVGVRHLQPVLVALDAPADDAALSRRQGLLQVIGMGMEEDEIDDRRVVGAAHAIGLAAVARGDVVEHVQRHGRDPPGFRRDQLGPVGAVDHARRQVEDQVDQPRAGDARDQLLDTRADAGGACAYRQKGERESRAAWQGNNMRPVSCSQRGVRLYRAHDRT